MERLSRRDAARISYSQPLTGHGMNGGACPICNGVMRNYRHDWVFRCLSCELLKSSLDVDIPSAAAETVVDEQVREIGLATLREKNNRRILEILVDLLPGRGHLLDVGSGPGFFLRQAQAAGFETEGVEPDANVVDVARREGIDVRHGFFPDVLAEGEQFDAIVFNDVLEHIPDLAGTLSASFKHLTPGGAICLSCPDKRGFFFRVATILDRLGISGPYQRLWQVGIPSPHVWYFTGDLLDRAAANAGFMPAARGRLSTIDIRGLWSRIRTVKNSSLLMSVAGYAFSMAAFPLLSLFPSDAIACFYRKPLRGLGESG